MGDYAAKELKYKRAAMIADDIAYGYELNAGFQRAFEDAGGKVVQKLWSPLVTARLRHLYRVSSSRTSTSSSSASPARTDSSSSSSTRNRRKDHPAPRRTDRRGRVAAAADGRGGDRPYFRLLVLGADRHSDQQEIRGRHEPRLQGRSGLLCRRNLHQRRGAGSSAKEDRQQDRGQERPRSPRCAQATRSRPRADR